MRRRWWKGFELFPAKHGTPPGPIAESHIASPSAIVMSACPIGARRISVGGTEMARSIAIPRKFPRRADRRGERISVQAPISRGFAWVRARTTDERLIVLLTTLISVWAYVWYSRNGLNYGYGDALSRMMIARRVVDGRTPGIAQLGTTWLPLQPILMLPLIWNDTLFHDGFAGSFPSMVAYVIASVYIYRMVRLLFSARGAAWVGALVFIINPSVVYMQTTAMSEIPMICTATAAIYYMLVWTRSFHTADLIKSAVAVFAGTAIRYDGWPLAVAFALVVVYAAWRHLGYQGAEAWAILYGLLAFAGCAAWVIYNQVIFHDPLLFVFFGNSKNSVDLAGAPAYHNAKLAFEMYGYASGDTVGWVTMALAAVGFIVFLVRYRLQASMLPVYALLIPFVYYWLTFFLGFDSIFVPQLGFHQYWNSRFGLQLVPAVAFFIGYFASRWRPLLVVALGVVVWFAVTDSIGQTPFAVRESSQNEQGIIVAQTPAKWFVREYHGGNILVSYWNDAPTMFYMYQHISDDNFVTDSNGAQFTRALKYPQLSVEWVLYEDAPNNPIWVKLHKSKLFHDNFVFRKQIGYLMFYERVTPRQSGARHGQSTATSASAQGSSASG